MRHPRETVAMVMAAASITIIVVNALFLQRGPHPAPLLATPPTAAPLTQKESAMPPHRPLPTAPAEPAPPARSQAQVTYDIQRELRSRGYYSGDVDGIWGNRTTIAAREFLRATQSTLKPEPSESFLHAVAAAPAKPASLQTTSSEPAAAVARESQAARTSTPSKRLIAIQRALAEFGYGQIKPTGVHDEDTRAAIENFQRDHRLPADGRPSERFVRELTAMTGRGLEE
jgi:peptidoglycan hydrolase-like protein with peptidoglycan-binding domain